MAFIVFEGLDGSGKTSLIQKLKDYVTHLGIVCTVTREPGGTSLGDEIRKILLRTNAEVPVPECEILLYEAIRAQHVATVLKPALKKQSWVLCDRFTGSTIAFQAAGRSLSLTEAVWLNEFATRGLKPDLNILLDLSPELSLGRQKIRIQTTGLAADRFELEKQEFHEKVRQGYLHQASLDPKNWFVLDASKSLEELFTLVLQELKNRKWLN